MTDRIAYALAMACCAGIGMMAALALADEAPPPTIRVVDGDTIVVNDVRVRLHGVDAPEKRQTCLDVSGTAYACGAASAAALSAMIARDPRVTCASKARDKFGRTVADCWNSEGSLGARLVAQGWAVAYRRYSRAYVDYEDTARAEKLGMWSGSFTRPELYRKESKR